jgi:hypothetical protein
MTPALAHDRSDRLAGGVFPFLDFDMQPVGPFTTA